MPKKEKNYVQKTFTFDGKRYYAVGKDEAEAIEKRALMKDKLKRGENQISGSMTVRAWAAQYLDTYITPRIKEPGDEAYSRKTSITKKSAKMYQDCIQNFLIPQIGNLKMKDVRDTHLQKILNAMAGKSVSYVKKVKLVLHAVFNRAYKSRLILYDPSEDLTLPSATQGKRRSITDAERKALHQVAGTHRLGLWIETLLGTGIRPGESAALNINDFDFEKEMLHITKDIESGTDVIGPPKTPAGYRDIPIPKVLVPRLKTAFAGKKPFDFAFPQKDGKSMMTTTCIQRSWGYFKRQMDLALGAVQSSHGKITESVIADDLKLYCLRHTYCTDLQAAGVPINVAKYLMGHSDISTTANIYTHTNEKIIRMAAEKINQANQAKKKRAGKKAAVS